ncbi:molybdenum cofactor oxidoreductase [Denitratisoma sp. DHT3]|uniref:molybdopterin-dependent oxidoreductase n=1 Tax=Denitratisoma sp. DHT3 TaxID=1981880 RepID=UPI0011983075|nr:molybdopterin-dependent oxidoreductase [Denitratisoma sp. DHT3]QDX81970.1 molybdenum cofactor oxidoreductase [Denitratisoma sp. DHT3]
MALETIPTYCALCISRCGCLATVEDGRLARIEPDPLHPTGRSICVKARAAPELVAHPARLTTPLRRTRPKGEMDAGWQAIGWDEAIALAGERLRAAGPAATAFAVATPSGTAIADSFGWIHRLAHLWGSPNMVFATENCNWHRDFGPFLTWGNGLGMPDYERTATILLWGCNPTVTWLAQAEQIRAAQRRGARLIAVDPRQGGLANGADLWLPLRPGTDAALALGLIHLLLAADGADTDFLRRHSDAFASAPDGEGMVLERLAELAAAWPPERVARETGIDTELLQRTAELLATAKPVSLYTWTGTCQQEQATAASRAINILYALTGSLGQPGGNRWFPKPRLNDIAAFEAVPPECRQRTLGLAERPLGPPSRGWITSRDLYRTIVSGEPYPVRALVAFGGNFLVSKPATRHAEAALAKLDFFVQTELFETPTARWADLLLPAASCWEREGLQAGFMVTPAADAHLQLRPAVVAPPGAARADTRIVFDLAAALGLAEDFFGGSPEAGLAHVLAPSGVDAAALRAAPRGLTVPQLSAEPALAPISLWCAELAAHGGQALPEFTPPAAAADLPYALTCGKTAHYCHSQFRQLESLRSRQPGPEAELASDVAAARGIASGDAIVIRTADAEMHCTALVSRKLAAGTVWAHYGWWDAQQPINYNACIDGERFDSVSGSNALRGVPCDVRRRLPLDPG